MTVRIIQFDRPSRFVDAMVRGPFRAMEHEHLFLAEPSGTLMRDTFAYESPYGLFVRLADALFLERHLRRFLAERNRIIKETAESGRWKKYL